MFNPLVPAVMNIATRPAVRPLKATRRRPGLGLAFGLLASLCWIGLGAVAAQRPDKPNIVFILTDDLGINDLHCYGRPDHHTPNLDRLAAQGMRFTSAYCAQPICSASRAAILTGVNPARLHLTTYLPGRPDCVAQRVLHPEIQMQVPLEVKMIPRYFKEAGYVSAAIGKWHVGGEGFGPLEHGFDFYHAGQANTTPSATEGGKGEYDLTAAAERFIETNRSRPFLLYLAHNSPHIPYAAQPARLENNQRAFEPVYAAVIETLDDTVGRLLAKLESLHLAESTIVIFTSDNGGLHVPEGPHPRVTYNAPYRAGKGFVYEGGLRIPLIVRWPGHVPAGAVVESPVVNTDWLPTLLELAGQPAPAGLDGVSLAGLLTGSSPAPSRTLYWHFPHYTNQGSRPSGAVRDGHWMLVEYYDLEQAELYDISADPGQQVDLSARDPGRVAQMRSALAKWRKSINAQETRPNPNFDAAKYRELYLDVDASRFEPKRADGAQWETMWRWRKAMNAVVSQNQRAKPNILIVLADDLGYSDLGCYGGEIATPNLDRLAQHGLRFTQFYNTARCWPTRAALMTGYYPQQVRMDPPRGRVPAWTRTLPQLLQPLGYRSYHAGKWHVTGVPQTCADGGFDHSYRLEDHDRHFNPKKLFEDDRALPTVPPNSGYYTETAFTDHLIAYLKEHAARHPAQPFFAYLAFTSPHFPLQAPAEDIARYRETYLVGWEAIREARYRRQRQLGLVDCALSPPEPEICAPSGNPGVEREVGPGELAYARPWNSLTPEQRQFQASKMSIHAAMVDRIDREVGKVLNQLQRMGVLDNTVIFFLSDNGASAELLIRGDGNDPAAPPGSAASFLCLGPGWSTVSNTPFRRHKIWVHEGGISTPLIVHWPNGIAARGELRHDIGHVVDFAPTLLELAGAAPGLRPTGAPPFPGLSLVPTFRDHVQRQDLTPVFFHHENNRALRLGDWKIVSAQIDGGTWCLYNLATDRAEGTNLAGLYPDRVLDMSNLWQRLEDEFRRQAGPANSAEPGK